MQFIVSKQIEVEADNSDEAIARVTKGEGKTKATSAREKPEPVAPDTQKKT